MTGIQILALVAFVALALALVLVLRGMGQIIAATRADEAFRRSVADIVGRTATTLGDVLEQASAARYRAGPHPDLDRTMGPTTPRIAELAGEMSALAVPVDRRADRDTIARDLAAASDALATLDRALAPGVDVETERRIALKRGYLGLAHAARSLADHGDAIASAPARPDRRRRRR